MSGECCAVVSDIRQVILDKCVFGSGQGSEEVKFIINQCAGWAQGLIFKRHVLSITVQNPHIRLYNNLEPKNKALYESMSMDECEKERKNKTKQGFKCSIRVTELQKCYLSTSPFSAVIICSLLVTLAAFIQDFNHKSCI